MKNQLLSFSLGILITLASVIAFRYYSLPHYKVKYQLSNEQSFEVMIQSLKEHDIEYSFEYDFLKRYWVRPHTDDANLAKRLYKSAQISAYNKPLKQDK